MLKQNRKNAAVLLILVLCLCTADSFAVKRYWVGNNTNKNWNATGNWSATSGGTSGASVPVSTDSVYFNGSGTGQCSINAAVSIKRLEMASGYTDTVKQNTNTITVGTGGMVLSGGVFKGGTATIGDGGVFTLSGNKFTSTSSTLTIEGNYSFSSGTFTPNSGTVLFNTTCTITGSTTFYRLTLSTSGASVINTISSGTVLICLNLFKTDGSNALSINIGDIVAQGDITFNNSHTAISSGGNATLTINGTGSQLFTGKSGAGGQGKFCNVTINKASGTLTLKDYISMNGNWKYVQGAIDVTTYTSEVLFYNTTAHRISGKHALGNVSFEYTAATNSLTIPAGDTLTILGTMKVEGSLNGRLDSGVVNAKGDITLAYTHAGAVINVATLISGSANQLFTGGSLIGQSRIGAVKINKTGGTLTLKNIITVGGQWVYLSGTIDGSTYNSTVAFAGGTRSVTGSHSLYNVCIYASGSASVNNLGSSDTLTVLGELKTDGSSFATINTGVVNVKGDINLANTSSGGGAGSAVFHICGTGTQTFTGNGVANLGYAGAVHVNKPSGTLYLSSIITLGAGNWTYTRGNVDGGSSTVMFYGSGNVSCKNGTASMGFNNVTVQNGTRTVTGLLKTKGNITIASGKVLDATNNGIHIAGNWSNSGTFTSTGSAVVCNGTGNQYILKSSGTEVFDTLEIKKTGGKLYLNSPVTAAKKIILTKGILATTATNYLNFSDNAVCDQGKDTSYICGPVRKTGNDAFTFPLGDTLLGSGAFHPLGITAPSNVTDAYTAKYFSTGQTYGTSLVVDSLSEVSNCEYWTLTRNTGTSNVTASIGWNSNSCNIFDKYDVAVAGWNGSAWDSYGKASLTGGGSSGMINALRAFTFSLSTIPIAIGSPVTKYPTSECVLKKKLDAGYYSLRNGLLKFKFDEEYVNNGQELDFKIYDKDRVVVISSALTSVTLNVLYKDNRWALNLFAISPSLPAGYYVLEVKDRKGEISMLRFKI